MRRGQVFVRATTKEGKWGNVDVFDLDDESFRAFVLQYLPVTMIANEYTGEIIKLKERTIARTSNF